MVGFDEGVWSNSNGANKGSAVVWKDNFSCVERWKDTEGRIAAAVLEDKDFKVGVCSIYAPNVNASRDSRDEYIEFMNKVGEYITKIKIHTEYVLSLINI